MPERIGYIQFRISDQNRAGLERLRQKFPQFNLTAVGDMVLRAGIATIEGNPVPGDGAALRSIPETKGEAAMTLVMAGAAAQSPPALVVVPAAPVSVPPAPVAGPAALPAGKVRRVHMDMGVRSPAPVAGLGKGM